MRRTEWVAEALPDVVFAHMTTALARVKQATVALALLNSTRGSRQPFTIVGTGFCIDRRGIVVTCRHVLEQFMTEPLNRTYARARKGEWDEPTKVEIETLTPHVVFYQTAASEEKLTALLVGPASVMVKTDHDIGLLRVHPHSGLPNGFPFVEIASYGEIDDGLDVGVCGFPLGSFLHDQIGSVTSSFTRGIVSSTIPVHGVALDYLRGFQLNVFATHGNSGGPAFVYQSGRVFGAVESNVIGQNGKPIPQLIKCASVYAAIENDAIARMLSVPLGTIPEVPD